MKKIMNCIKMKCSIHRKKKPLWTEMAIHSSTLAWKIPWMEEPDRLQSMGSQRVGHDWATSLSRSALLDFEKWWGLHVLKYLDSVQADWVISSFFLINFYWSIFGLQCCVNFCCTVKWTGYMYVYIYMYIYALFLDFLPIYVTPEHWVEVPVLFSIFSLVTYFMCVCLQLLSHVWIFFDHMDCSSPGSSVHGILQARILEWIDISSSRGSSWLRDWTWGSCVSCIGRQILYNLESPLSILYIVSTVYMSQSQSPNSSRSRPPFPFGIRILCHFIFFYFNFVLEYGWLTMLWQFQVNSKGTQPRLHVSILSPAPLPPRLPHNIEQSSLCYTVGPFG